MILSGIRYSANTEPALPVPVQIRAKAISKSDARVHHIGHFFTAPHTAYKSMIKQNGSDAELAALDDSAKTLSVLGIAGLISMSPQTTISKALPVWLGALGWLASMSILPGVISAITELKTGMPMFFPYRSSQNDIKNLMENPDYLPTQVIPASVVKKLYKTYQIPSNNINSNERLQAKLKQISVQSHTWWMLAAGPATPLIASVFCDVTEHPIKHVILNLEKYRIESKIIEPAIKANNAKLFREGVRKLLEITIDKAQTAEQVFEKPPKDQLLHNLLFQPKDRISRMALWWEKLPLDILSVLDLDSPSVLSKLGSGSILDEKRFDRLAHHLSKKLRPLKVREALESALLKRSQESLDYIEPLLQLLRSETSQKLLQPEERMFFTQQLRLAKGRSQATIGQFLSLLDFYEQHMHLSPKELALNLKNRLEKANISYIEQLIESGNLNAVKELTGNYFQSVLKQLKARRFSVASQLMGETPRDMLLRSTQSMAKRLNWIRLYPIALGSTLLVGTAVFVSLFLGENIQPKAAKGKGASRA